ncbi:MAG: preprotein translocase subunit SecA [Alphaproteobacteria bacterium]|nr:preprotein translocase subunit SecA [Alphaproteobacteria bacterium]
MLLKRLFGSSNDRYLKQLQKIVRQINDLEASVAALSDEQLKARTPWLKERLQKGETLDDILPDAFATVREAAKRTLGQRHFDVQLMGGIVLHRGQIAEMKTGEGKTLVATLPVYLNALTGKGVHVVTVNDYLAKRDSEWMGAIYQFLGLSVGCIIHDLNSAGRKAAYACDVTYGTNNEFGFDYLRDNMRFRLEDMVQRPFYYAIVDEVDSILIDEARTPLIISGQAEDSSANYQAVDLLMHHLRPEHYEKDEKHKTVTFTEAGNIFMEELMQKAGLIQGSLYDLANIAFVHHAEQALRAHTMFERDVDYIVKDGKVVIVDEFTGRIMAGRRFSDGLHQALEAKEHVKIEAENQTVATITFQNYFRMYPKLAGMTGTAMTEAGELDSIYKLRVIEIPANVPVQRQDLQDEIYATAAEKYDAIIKEIEKAHARRQPLLVGTTSIEKSEYLADLLRQKTNLRFEVLNARHHEREAYIVAQAGAPDAITIATNMAGRGTDIKLGGNIDMRMKETLKGDETPEQVAALRERLQKEIDEGHKIVVEAGGLYVIGTERHENRRIDNQLRGRSGRQGDPGMSKFYVSLEDDLMRIFGSDRLKRLLKTFRLPEGEVISHPWITKAIQKAQQKVEELHFLARKNLLKIDDVMNEQRKVVYGQRKELIQSEDVSAVCRNMREETIAGLVTQYMSAHKSEIDYDGLRADIKHILALDVDVKAFLDEGKTAEDLQEYLSQQTQAALDKKTKPIPPDILQALGKDILLQTLDAAWKDHLHALDFLKAAVNMRQDPLNEYKREAFVLFADMLAQLRQRVTVLWTHISFNVTAPAPAQVAPADASKFKDVGRNEPCPCGSGKKFKHCHGKI